MRRTIAVLFMAFLLMGSLIQESAQADAFSFYRDFSGRAMDDPSNHVNRYDLSDSGVIKTIERPYLMPAVEIDVLYGDDDKLLKTMGALWYDLLQYEIRTEGKVYADTMDAVEIYTAFKTRPGIAFFGAPDPEADYYNVVFFCAGHESYKVYWLEFDLEETIIRYKKMEFSGAYESAEELYEDQVVQTICEYCCDVSSVFGLVPGQTVINKAYDVSYTGVYRYFDAIYQRHNSGELPPFSEMGSVEKTARIRQSGNVNVRKGPGKNTAKIGSAMAGKEYEVLGIAENGWLKIRLENGKEGYISPNMIQ